MYSEVSRSGDDCNWKDSFLQFARGGGIPPHLGSHWEALGLVRKQRGLRGKSGPEPLLWFSREGMGEALVTRGVWTVPGVRLTLEHPMCLGRGVRREVAPHAPPALCKCSCLNQGLTVQSQVMSDSLRSQGLRAPGFPALQVSRALLWAGDAI